MDDNYIKGYVDGKKNFEEVLASFMLDTNSKFSTRHSSSAFSKSTYDVLKGVNLRSDLKWSKLIGDLPVPFDGVPFVLCGRPLLKFCKYGPVRHHPKPGLDSVKDPGCEGGGPKRRRRKPKKSCKVSCPAYVKIERIIRFHTFAIDGWEMLSANGIRKRKSSTVTAVMRSLAEDKSIDVVERFHVVLPDVEAHANHTPTAKSGAQSNQVDMTESETRSSDDDDDDEVKDIPDGIGAKGCFPSHGRRRQPGSTVADSKVCDKVSDISILTAVISRFE